MSEEVKVSGRERKQREGDVGERTSGSSLAALCHNIFFLQSLIHTVSQTLPSFFSLKSEV